jgi:RNA polymerase sigma-32 factor
LARKLTDPSAKEKTSRSSAKASSPKKPAASARTREADVDEEGDGPESLRGDAGESDGEEVEEVGDRGEVIEAVGEVVEDGEDDFDADREESPDSGRTSMPPESAPMSSAALSRTDPLQAYLREVQRYKLLTAQEEQDLTRQYVETQDVRTAAKLVTANLRLVVKLAYEYRRAYKNIMDLIQEGNIGLMQAVKRYDPYRGVKLSSYAAWWIRAYMLRFILNNWRLVKLGTTQAQRKLFFNLNKEKAKLAALGIDPSADLIAERLGVETH